MLLMLLMLLLLVYVACQKSGVVASLGGDSMPRSRIFKETLSPRPLFAQNTLILGLQQYVRS